MVPEETYDLQVALPHVGARALARASRVSTGVFYLLTISFALLGSLIVVDIVGWAWQTNPATVVMLATGGSMAAIGVWGTMKVALSRAWVGFPVTMTLDGAGIQLDYPNHDRSVLLWSEPEFELELRESRPRSMRSDGPLLNVEWNEEVPGQRLPRHVHAIVSRAAFEALDREASLRGFAKERIVTELPPSVSFLFRLPGVLPNPRFRRVAIP